MTQSRQDTLTELLDLLLHTNATIRLHNRATGDTLPLIPRMTITALAGMPDESFPRLADRTRATLSDALFLAECPHPVLNTPHL